MVATATGFLFHVEFADGRRHSTWPNKFGADRMAGLLRRAGQSIKVYQESHIGFLRLS